jgi:tRNA threonylcarbamoyladenosine biosynthesis protein TsaB
VAGVCSLEVLALQAGCFPGPICAALDARRGEVYLSRFRRHGEELRRESEARTADPHAAFTAAPESLSGDQTLFIGSGARRYRELIARSFGPAACFAPAWCDTLRAGVVAVLAEALFRRGAAEDAALIVPRYLRAADALPPRPAAIDKPRAI